MEMIQSILTNNPCYKAGKKISVKGLMLHSVGCPQPNAETFVRKWNNPKARERVYTPLLTAIPERSIRRRLGTIRHGIAVVTLTVHI